MSRIVYSQALYWIAFISLILFPIAITSLTIINGLINFLLALAGLYLWIIHRDGNDSITNIEKMFLYCIVLIVFVAFFVTTIAGIDYVAIKKLGKFLYLLLAIPVYSFFRYIRVSQSTLWYGFVIGVIVAAAIAFYDVSFQATNERYAGRAHGVSHPITFGNMSLLMGAMSLAGIGWFKKQQSPWYALLPIVGALLGLLASFLSHARGGWVAIPVIAILLIWFYGKYVAKWKLGLGLMLLVLLLLSVYKVPQTGVANKLDVTVHNVQQYFNTDVNHISHGTSIGSRFEMWQASWTIFLENPVIGVGWGNYQEYAKILVEQGLRHRSAGDWPHPHNQFLSSLVSGGILGFIATVALFVVPIVIFYRVIASRNHTDDAKRMALAGLILVVSFAIFNLSESFLERSRTVGFFVFYLAVCMAGIRETKPEVDV